MPEKVIGRKAYGSIPHLPGSRMSDPSDKILNPGQDQICRTGRSKKGKRYKVWVQEKVDGSCVSIVKTEDGAIIPVGRAGYRANTSPYLQHHFFSDWAYERLEYWDELLEPGERLVGEWCAQATGTMMKLRDDQNVFVAFDLFKPDGITRVTFQEFNERVVDEYDYRHGVLASPLFISGEPMDPSEAWNKLRTLTDEYIDPPEGVVYRVEDEKETEVLFVAKWLRPGKVDGKYLPDVEGSVTDEEIWLWRP